MKKTWIKLKRGILESKHIEQLGQAWYLYIYILDQADWETGTIPSWKDEYAADDLGKQVSTIREHRKYLDGKYISCKKNQHNQTITIFNWTDPRRYDGEVLNKVESTEFTELSFESSPQSSPQTILSQEQNDSSFIQSHNHISHNKDIYISDKIIYEPCDEDGNPVKEKKKKEPKEPTHPAIVAFRRTTGRYPPKTNYDWVIDILGDSPDELKLHECKANWDRRGYNGNSLKWVEWYRDGIPKQGFKKPDSANATREERLEYLKWSK
jgi:hypothetical protein